MPIKPMLKYFVYNGSSCGSSEDLICKKNNNINSRKYQATHTRILLNHCIYASTSFPSRFGKFSPSDGSLTLDSN